ncbi:NUDIX hydrolase [Halobacillus shinanisalinarum]|uniref:NUDIX hydrolase n=1 Tax=Halobacillus shinanisalinarum TaxID=2932258 RepID=A0ABY4H0D2_9BACI|nr:NUDIX hydrolase [Halobacillus shinanisalinarum]UOQ92467.1 NUDIX hydrolase [Halobacillus shinanisalinarum]
MSYVENLRKLVGHRPLILVGSVVVIVNNEGEILLQQRWFPEGAWGLPGGLMELGESTEDAAKREVFEETQLYVHHLELLNVYSGEDYFTIAKNGDEFYSVTMAYVTSSYTGCLQVDLEESIQCCFLNPAALPQQMVGSHRQIIEDYLRTDGMKVEKED